MFKSEKLRHRERRVAGLRATPAPASAIPSPQAIADLQAKIEGTIVLPTDPNYHACRQVFSHEFQSMPQLIVYCEVFEDVRHCLEFARNHQIWAVTRSGGHSTAGYSVNCDMVIDLSRMSYVVVNVAEKRAVIGAGAHQRDLFPDVLALEHRLHLKVQRIDDLGRTRLRQHHAEPG